MKTSTKTLLALLIIIIGIYALVCSIADNNVDSNTKEIMNYMEGI